MQNWVWGDRMSGVEFMKNEYALA